MEKPIKTLIIDDDPFIRELLQDKLNQFLPEVEIIDTADCGAMGIQQIEQYKPDLVFLDVEMTDMTGFEMLSLLGQINFQTIFITSYSHYAIKAIRFNALDYLLKPIDLGELKKAIKRYKLTINSTTKSENLKIALDNLKLADLMEHKLVLQTQEGELRLVLKNIIRVEGERNYSYIYLSNDKRKLVSKTLSDMEELLHEKGFFRCHKSFLVSINHIIERPTSVTLLMSDNAEVAVSRRKKEAFQEWFEASDLHNERHN